MLTGALLALFCAIAWTAANITIKEASRRFGPFPALVWAQVFGALGCAAVALAAEGLPPAIGGEALLAVAVAGVSAFMAYAGLFGALAVGRLAIVAPVVGVGTLISVLAGYFAFDEAVGVLGFAGVLLVVFGNGILARHGDEPASLDDPVVPARENFQRAFALSLLGALGFGILVPALDRVGAAVGSLWAVPLVWGLELSLAIPLLWLTGRLQTVPRTARDFFVAGRVGLFEVTGFIAITWALQHAPVSIVAPTASLATLFGVLAGVLLLGERISRPALFGGLLASGGIVLVNL